MFRYKRNIHASWCPEHAGPIKDTYAIEKNPQYRLEVQSKEAGQVWVLLSRHITDKKDFANNQKFITLHVKKSDGKRVYYPGEYLHEGIKINAPHYLAKISFSKGISYYTLIVSQLEALSKIHYTIRVYSSAEVSLGPVLNPYKNTRSLTDEWTKDTGGGCVNNPTFIHNPVYRLEIEGAGPLGAADVLFKVEGPRKFSVGFQLTPEVKTPSLPQMNSGPYRPGLAVLETSLPPGNYSIIPSTFNPGEVAPFFLTVSCSHGFKLNRVK
ncbi:hypothetical protein LOD99_4189 [Oopsacas minuta]|uniref:Peptidase C2 calpain domain-containing protein n=1 Tax=Oopsacas minuta TaxID=111878 RepID=A0AAV7JV35_9METZ|nr:hypothetical protein LOD99_4189 [Oopsacas minuta]